VNIITSLAVKISLLGNFLYFYSIEKFIKKLEYLIFAVFYNDLIKFS